MGVRGAGEGNLLADDEYWMSEAIKLSHCAEAIDEVPVGALIVKDHTLLAEGFNQPISSSDPTAHAEIVAIRAAAKALQNYRLPDTTLYVTIEPCTMCVGAMIHARIQRVVFGAREPRAGALCSQHQLAQHPAYNHRISVQGGVLEAECALLITDFFRRRRSAGT